MGPWVVKANQVAVAAASRVMRQWSVLGAGAMMKNPAVRASCREVQLTKKDVKKLKYPGLLLHPRTLHRKSIEPTE